MTIYFTDEICVIRRQEEIFISHLGTANFYFIFTDLFLKKKNITILFLFKL